MKIVRILRSLLSARKTPTDTFWEIGTKVASIIPLGIGLGVIGQVVMLTKWQALPFFSWNQAVNDAITLSVPLLSWYAGWFFSKIDDSDYSPKWWWFLGRSFTVILAAPLAMALTEKVIAMFLSGISLQLVNTGLLFALAGHLCHCFHVLFNKFTKVSPIENAPCRNFLKPAGVMLVIALVLSAVGGTWSKLYEYIYWDLYVVSNGERIKLSYMNDRYVISGSGRIIPNNENLKFEKGSGN